MDEVPERAEGVAGGVVVGVDDSEGSRAALTLAAQEARLRGCPLHVVRAWGLSSAPRPASWAPGYVPSFAEYHAAVHDWLAAEVTIVLGPRPETEVVLHPVHAPAAQVLVDASARADLVVVGGRGHGGFAGLVLGSVSDQVVRHAHAPVLVVRGHRHTGRPARPGRAPARGSAQSEPS